MAEQGRSIRRIDRKRAEAALPCKRDVAIRFFASECRIWVHESSPLERLLPRIGKSFHT